MPSRLLFLPGASGNVQFWSPVANLLAHRAEKIHLGWPGFGPTPPDPRVNGLDDLVAMVVGRIDRPTALIAQSMGGVIAIRAALAKPGQVTHLVLAATSGGVDMAHLGAQNWRPPFIEANPSFPHWFTDYHEDLAPTLSALNIPTLLLWGDADPISPVRVGRHLASLIPKAQLHVIPGGNHDLAIIHAGDIASLVDAHLSGKV
jgi:poly(3-hydroxyoctanoate) depolymerase